MLLLAIVLSGPLRFTDFDYPFGIFKVFLQKSFNIAPTFIQDSKVYKQYDNYNQIICPFRCF